MEDNNSSKMTLIDDGNYDFSNRELLSGTNIGDVPTSVSMDSFFDELLKDTRACTHTHTCNPPGPDYTHTHTCFHVHSQIVPLSSDEKSGNNDDSAESGDRRSKKRSRERGSNIEAVRKYRQKKKVHAELLEEEVNRLKALNQQLLKRLQSQAALEAEVARLKCLLVDIRGRIEGEIGSFPYQRPVAPGDVYQNIGNTSIPGSYMIPCNAQCGDQINCLHDGKAGEGGALNGEGLNGCDFESLNCIASLGSAPSFSGATTNVTTAAGSRGKARRKS